MLQLACCISFRMNVADLFHLKAALKTDGIINSSSNKENVFRICLFGSKPLKSLLILDDPLDLLRKGFHLLDICITLLLCDLPSYKGKFHSKNIGSDQLCTVSLGSSNRNLRSCKCIEHIIRLSCNGGTNHVNNSQGRDSLFLTET